jgi:alpha-tubulin suppressor-like RCC1 family protein
MPESQIRSKRAFVWAFGKNQEGELALGVYKDALIPRNVAGIKSGQSAKWISSSNHHTALVTKDGLLLVSGSSLHGKLGLEGINKTNINRF